MSLLTFLLSKGPKLMWFGEYFKFSIGTHKSFPYFYTYTTEGTN